MLEVPADQDVGLGQRSQRDVLGVGLHRQCQSTCVNIGECKAFRTLKQPARGLPEFLVEAPADGAGIHVDAQSRPVGHRPGLGD